MRLSVTYTGAASDEKLEANRRHAKSLGLKGPEKMDRPPLAVVGGGPSVHERLDELRAWPGDIWVSCGAFPWARENGLEGVFFSADPQPLVADLARGATRAVVSSCSDPSVFAALEGADVTVFDLYETEEESNHGVSTATAAPVLSAVMGYPSVSFFGCDSSYEGQTHIYGGAAPESAITVACGGVLYDTTLQLLAQAECLAEVMRAAPGRFICRSGGLLAAMIETPDYDVVAVTRALYMALRADGAPLHEICPPKLWSPAA